MFFFFKQKTAYESRISDWSSDVCSSDLEAAHVARPVGPRHRSQDSRQRRARSRFCGRPRARRQGARPEGGRQRQTLRAARTRGGMHRQGQGADTLRTEERREGKEWVSKCNTRWEQDK